MLVSGRFKRLIDPEMAAYLETLAEMIRTIGPPSPDASLQAERDFQEAMNDAMPAESLPMAEVEDRWIAARGRRIFTRMCRMMTLHDDWRAIRKQPLSDLPKPQTPYRST
jgi:hypothetical protein